MAGPFEILFVPLNHDNRLIEVAVVHMGLIESTVDSTIVHLISLRIEIALFSLIDDIDVVVVLFIKLIICGFILC
jgi:hypothetical protein